MRIETITSVQNPKIKMLLALGEKSRTRRGNALFVVEGRREILHCAASGFEVKALFTCPDIISEREEKAIAEQCGSDISIFRIPAAVYDRIALRDSTEGIVAEVVMKERPLSGLRLRENPLILVLESVEKPGNLGAVLRTADAADADAVIICDPLTDLYNPNLIRASLGAIFTRQVAAATSGEAIKWLKDNNIKIYTAQLQAFAYKRGFENGLLPLSLCKHHFSGLSDAPCLLPCLLLELFRHKALAGAVVEHMVGKALCRTCRPSPS